MVKDPVLFICPFIDMIMPAKPSFVVYSILDFFQILIQRIRSIPSRWNDSLNAGWCAMRDHIIAVPAVLLKAIKSPLKLCFRWHLFLPPRKMVDSVHGIPVFQICCLFPKLRIIRFKDSIRDIMGTGTSLFSQVIFPYFSRKF
jgi:hypothetical protein